MHIYKALIMLSVKVVIILGPIRGRVLAPFHHRAVFWQTQPGWAWQPPRLWGTAGIMGGTWNLPTHFHKQATCFDKYAARRAQCIEESRRFKRLLAAEERLFWRREAGSNVTSQQRKAVFANLLPFHFNNCNFFYARFVSRGVLNISPFGWLKVKDRMFVVVPLLRASVRNICIFITV